MEACSTPTAVNTEGKAISSKTMQTAKSSVHGVHCALLQNPSKSGRQL